jgi:dyslexia susceptibility 1 candidate gene 1 protein
MPIAVRDYEWEQTEKMLFITVPLKGVAKQKVDILSTESYIKIHYPPYFFECFLFAPVDDLASAAEIGNGAAVFKLQKVTEGLWPSLQCEDAGDKTVQKTLREAAITRYAGRAEKLKEQQSEIKHEHGKFAVRQQMKLEEEDRKRIEDLKEAERKAATEDLEHWKDWQKEQAMKEKEALAIARRAEELKRLSIAEAKKQEEPSSHSGGSQHTKRKTNIFQDSASSAPLREPGKITVTFTPRVFPTPTRESLAPEEDAWLAKQAEARRLIELDDKDLADEEKNPVWLRDKGNSFFKAGNYQAAVNAYTHAIRLDCKMPALYSNRAACHLKMNNLFKCIEDCSKALELLTPPVPQNAASRARVHVRRGTALCQLELYAEGLQDYEAALKLEPDNDEVRTDAQKIRDIVQGSLAAAVAD